MSAPEQIQVCAACGQPGQSHVGGDPKPNDLTVKPFLGTLRLICRQCGLVHMLDRAARGARP